MKWFQRKEQVAGTPATRTPGAAFPTLLTLADWHANPALVDSARELFDSALWRRMLGVAYNGLPLEYLRKAGASPTDASRALGRIEGYVDCLNLFQSLGIHAAESVEMPITWGAVHDETTERHLAR